MDFWKFALLLHDKALYLCRADKLQDKFEGTYSRQQIKLMEDDLKRWKAAPVIEQERESRERARKSTYIHCWCMSDTDLDLMWKGYVKDPGGVAIKSSVGKLKQLCDDLHGKEMCGENLNISMVDYYDQAKGEMIEYGGSLDAFLKKDNHFQLDKEFRLISNPNCGDPQDFILLPVDLHVLIDEVVTAPGASSSGSQHIRKLMDNAGLNEIPLYASRDDREPVL